MTWIFGNTLQSYYKSPHKNCNIETALIAAVSDLRILGPRYTGRIPERSDNLISSWWNPPSGLISTRWCLIISTPELLSIFHETASAASGTSIHEFGHSGSVSRAAGYIRVKMYFRRKLPSALFWCLWNYALPAFKMVLLFRSMKCFWRMHSAKHIQPAHAKFSRFLQDKVKGLLFGQCLQYFNTQRWRRRNRGRFMWSKYQAVAVKTFQYCLKSLTFLILYQETWNRRHGCCGLFSAPVTRC